MTQPTPIIGVFDSGVGGLTVLRELLRQVPHAEYLYFGDTARLPYGSKSAATVAQYAISSAKFLEERGATYLVIACNTATALALDAIKNAVGIPALGVISPGARMAAATSANGSRKAVVIATEGTVNSHAYRAALEREGMRAKEKACPLLVPLVEESWLDHTITEQVAAIYLSDLFSGDFADADVLVLGCTHYPLLRPVFRRLLPARIHIVDSAESTAAVAKLEVTAANGGAANHAPRITFFATDSVEKFRRAGEKFLGRAIDGVTHVAIDH